ncbi:MAG TPA: hypothetical protein VGQ36_25600 [Thermoanaerobaculia bacterium]|jgi:hypothetical protein|nr:hypothetical protein [Thermoanaerobaculia bacterium]
MTLIAAVVALRLMNPNDVALEATLRCGDESRMLRLEAREVRDVDSCTSASSSQPLVALETSMENGVEWQTALEPDAACAIPSMYAPLFACRNGAATAYVAPVEGASYEWSAEGAAILGGANTNRVALRITGDTSVQLRCTVRTSECAATTGSGVIQIREPIAVREFKVPATTNANEPLTITWSYLPGREPQSQILTGDLFPQPVPLNTSQRSYTFTPQTGGARTAELRASYARAITVAPRSKKRRRSSASGAPNASECPAALATAKVEVRGCVESEPVLDAPFDAAAGSTFEVAVDIDDGQKVEWSVENGSVQSVSPFFHEATIVAGTSGVTTVTARVERKAGCFATASAPVALILPASQCAVPPVATLSNLSVNCDQAIMNVSFTGNGPFAGEWSDGTPFRSSTNTGHVFTKPGTFTIHNFRDSACFGTVNGAKAVEQFRPVVLLNSTDSCNGTNLVATFKGVPPFVGSWYDGEPISTSDTTISRTVKGLEYSHQNRWLASVSDSVCSQRSYSRFIEIPETPTLIYGGYACQTDPLAKTWISAYFKGGRIGPFSVEWADGVKATSTSIYQSPQRSVGPITAASAPFEIVRATIGECELDDVAGLVTTLLNRPSAMMQTPPTTNGCTGEPLTATLSRSPLPEATIEWVFSTNARVISGQGTPTITFTVDSPLKFDLAVVTKYPDGRCSNYPWTTPKVTYTIAQRRTVKNIRLEPSTIQAGERATITWELFENPGVSVTTTQARKLELHQAEECCTAYFVDTTGPGTVPIYIDWYDPCRGSQRETLTLTIAP